jgi:hypothetical protein
VSRIEERLSPDGRYKLVLKSIERTPECWNALEIEVRRTSDDALIGTTVRNYPNPHILHFVQQDGVDYLVLSENYHGGYGVMNLATGEKAVYDPGAGRKEGDPHEEYWCWAGPVSHDPEKKELVIVGCYWACPYDHITFDFSNPMAPPYAILKEEPEPYEEDEEDA